MGCLQDHVPLGRHDPQTMLIMMAMNFKGANGVGTQTS